LRRRDAGSGQAIVKAGGQGAGLPVAGFVGVLARFVPGHQFDHTQRRARRAVGQPTQAVQSHLPPGGLGGQEEQLVGPTLRHGPQGWKQRAQGLANAGGRLDHERVRLGAGPVNSRSHLALPGPERSLGKVQLAQSGVTPRPMRALLPGPAQVTVTQGRKVLTQIVGLPLFVDRMLGLVGHIQVHQAERDGMKAPGFAHQPAIDLQLRPMQRLVIGGDGFQAAAKRLDLLQHMAVRVVAIGPATHLQVLVLARQGHLGLVLGPTARGHQRVALAALLRGGSRCEPQVQIARLGRELAQGAHGHGVQGRGRFRHRWGLIERRF
jgi:hypothetical protein